MNEIFICVLSLPYDTSNTGRQINANFSGLEYKRIQYSFFYFPLKISHNTGMEMNKNCKVFFQRNLSCPIQIYQ